MADSEGTRKLEAILAADVAGYSRLMQHDDEATVAALEASRAVFRERIEAHRGRVVDTAGDSVLAVFETATGAVRAAFEIQAVLAERNQALPDERRMRFRIGINLGEVIERADGTVYGDGVNVAARLQSIGEPGGVTVSGTVFDQVRNRVQLNFDFIGEQQVKNIAELIRAYRVAEGKPGSAKRLTLLLRRRDVRRTMISAGGVLVLGAVTGSWLWSQVQKRVPPINNRIAVLPFVSMSSSADDEYFADGITEELISRLSRIKGLEVIARTSVAYYKGTKKKVGQIAGELDVGTVLEGSVRKAERRVRITAQLINAANEAHMWSEDYDRELKDIFAVQGDIAQRVTDALAKRLNVVSTGQPRTSLTPDLEAYNAYLKGRFYYNKGSTEGLKHALQYYEEAIQRDGSFAVAYAALADTYEQLSGYDGRATERMPKARVAAVKALELDQSLAEAHMALAAVKAFYDWDFSSAEESFKRALALNPNSELVHDWYGWYLLWFRRWVEAIAEVRRAVELDPVSVIMKADLGWALVHGGRWDEGIEQARKIFELDPHNALGLGIVVWAYIGKGMYKEALAPAEKGVEISGRHPGALQGLAAAYALSGDTVRALKLLDEMKHQPKSRPGQAWFVASVYGAVASQDRRYIDDYFVWLDKAYQEHDFNLVWSSCAGLLSANADQPDARWIAFRKRFGLPP
jgi:TolB-like protein/class 3 adenylate cyclase/Tfp pilus assembly protein PilF